MRKLLLCITALLLLQEAASAAPAHLGCQPMDYVRGLCVGTAKLSRASLGREPRTVAAASATVVAHPSGCPSRAFCGCGASVRVFGHPVRSLYLAAEWLRRFPRAAPASGMAAARPGHVFVLDSHVQGSIWLVYDANSGGGLTRIHQRDISGYTIVNPHT